MIVSGPSKILLESAVWFVLLMVLLYQIIFIIHFFRWHFLHVLDDEPPESFRRWCPVCWMIIAFRKFDKWIGLDKR